EKYLKYFITGCFVSLAYLTRTEGLLLLPLLIVTSVKTPNRFIKTLILLISFCVVSSPYFYGNFISTGDPLYSLHQRLYMVRDYREYVNGNGYGVTFPSPIVFIKNNLIWIMQQEILIFRDNINSLLYFDWFGPVGVFLLLVFLPSTWKKFKILYIYAFIIILVYTSAWSALFERS